MNRRVVRLNAGMAITCAIACAVAVVTSVLGAQGVPATAASVATSVIAGRVFRARDSIPVANALVTVEGTAISTRSGPDGRYRLAAVPLDARGILVTRIGYHPTEVPAGAVVGIARHEDVKMYDLPGWLHAVEILGEKRDIPPSLISIYNRAKFGWGNFFTLEDIEREQPYDVRSLLSTIPGAWWNDRGIFFSRCNEVFGGSVQLYIDGTRVRQNPSFGLLDALRGVPISEIQAVEVYNGTGEIPAEYLTGACAVIAVWTRHY